MAQLNLKHVALLLLIAQSLIAITAATDAKAIINCEQVSGFTNVPHNDAVSVAKKIHKCLGLTLEPAVKTRLETLKTKLPASVLNAVFLKDVCIRNKKFSEYLYVPADGYKYEDNVGRRLFTKIGKDWAHTKGDFRLIPFGKYFYIVSTNHNEYLFAGAANQVKDNRRRVFTKEPEVEDAHMINDKKALWELVPVENTGKVYIKNAEFGEHFYAVSDVLKFDKERRTVATWSKKDNGCVGHEQCIWEIKTC